MNDVDPEEMVVMRGGVFFISVRLAGRTGDSGCGGDASRTPISTSTLLLVLLFPLSVMVLYGNAFLATTANVRLVFGAFRVSTINNVGPA